MKRILLVDDQPHIIRVIKLALDQKGYHVDTAGDGLRALECLRAQRYDVLITDVQMPRMDGQQLCEAMHGEMPERCPFTLVVTARADGDIGEWAQRLPRTEFLEKPVSLRHLVQRLERLFTAAAPATATT